MSKQKFNFKTNLHLLTSDDDLRPVMSLIHFKDDFAYATDAHVLLKQHTSHHTVINPENLNGKAIHRKVFQLVKQKFYYVEATPEGLECKDGFGNEAFFKYTPTEDKNWIDRMEAVIPKGDCVEVDEIGVNLHLLNRLRKGMIHSGNGRGHKFSFYGKNRAVLVSSIEIEDQVGLVMPVMLC